MSTDLYTKRKGGLSHTAAMDDFLCHILPAVLGNCERSGKTRYNVRPHLVIEQYRALPACDPTILVSTILSFFVVFC